MVHRRIQKCRPLYCICPITLADTVYRQFCLTSFFIFLSLKKTFLYRRSFFRKAASVNPQMANRFSLPKLMKKQGNPPIDFSCKVSGIQEFLLMRIFAKIPGFYRNREYLSPYLVLSHTCPQRF